MNCPCGKNLEFKNCCALLIDGVKIAKTAEELMRSRYTAYTQSNLDYLQKTLAPESLAHFDVEATREWASQTQWTNLKVLSVKKGTETDKTGTVEFSATYQEGPEAFDLHEVSNFRKTKDGIWLYVDGNSHTHRAGEAHSHEPQEPIVRTTPKVGRNDACPCGSNKKYKKCCG